MYHMKNIIDHNEEISLPKCMYQIRNPNESLKYDIDIDQIYNNICNQVKKFLKSPKTKMTELEERQEQLIKKLDILYDRIKTISSYCGSNKSDELNKTNGATKSVVPYPEEVVLIVNPDNLPHYLKKLIKDPSVSVNMCWHIHSSVPVEKVAKIHGFVKTLKNADNTSKINLRLIFKSVSADTELKLSSLSLPIVGTVNILRYLSFVYPNIIPYDVADFKVDALLDICHLLEKSPEKTKEPLFKKLFSEAQDWIYKNKFSIVDLAAYNIVKQFKSNIKYVPKAWFDKCETICS